MFCSDLSFMWPGKRNRQPPPGRPLAISGVSNSFATITTCCLLSASTACSKARSTENARLPEAGVQISKSDELPADGLTVPAPEAFTVTVTLASELTSASQASQTVESGSTFSTALVAAAGYSIFKDSASYGTCPAGSWNADTYTTGLITADCSVSFESIKTFDMVFDINPNGDMFSADNDYRELVLFRDKLYFFATDGVHGRELWVYDEKSDPEMVHDINTSGDATSGSVLFVFKDKLYFVADDGTSGQELWVYDGENEPTILADINPGFGHGIGGWPNYLEFKDKLYFTADADGSGAKIWVYDGTNPPSEETNIGVAPYNNNFYNRVIFQDKLVFTGKHVTDGIELWVYDGTNPATKIDANNNNALESAPSEFTVTDSKIYMRVSITAWSDIELGVFDGSTVTVTDLYAGSTGSWPRNFVEYDGKVYFAAKDIDSIWKLWADDGVNPPSIVNAQSFSPLGVFNGMIWGGDSTATLDFYDGSTFLPFDDTITFARTASNGRSLISHVIINDKMYFAANNGIDGYEIFEFDGENAPTMWADLNPSGNGLPGHSSDIFYTGSMTILNGSIYFKATNGVDGIELWRYYRK